MNRRTAFALLAAGAMLCGAARAESDAERNRMRAAAEANTQLALAYMQRGDLMSAREKVEKALSQDPRSANTQLGAGFVYDRLGENERAEKYFEQAVKYSDGNPDMVNNLAVFLCRKGDKQRGEQYFVQAAGNPLSRTPAAAYTNAGRCAREDGRPADAEKHFRRALAVLPDFPDALLQLAEVSLELGNALQARAFLQRFLIGSGETAATAWLGYRIESALGDREQAEVYAERLRGAFATSDQTRELQQLEQARP